jgi:hypothetical protein
MLAFMVSVKIIAHEGRIGRLSALLVDSKPSNKPTSIKMPHFHGVPGEKVG